MRPPASRPPPLKDAVQRGPARILPDSALNARSGYVEFDVRDHRTRSEGSRKSDSGIRKQVSTGFSASTGHLSNLQAPPGGRDERSPHG